MKNKKTNDRENEKLVQKAKKLIGEPVTGYCSDAYNTLISVVQGVALAALCYIIQDHEKFASETVFFWPKVIVAFLIICTIWHRYIVENQYIAWTIGLFDTIIPMAFAVLQVFMVSSIPISSKELCLSYTFLFALGGIAYCNSLYRHNAKARKIYIAHFMDLGENFGRNFSKSFLVFARKSLRRMIICALISLIIYLWLNTNEQSSPRLSAAILMTFAVTSSGNLFRNNLRHYLNQECKVKTIFGW